TMIVLPEHGRHLFMNGNNPDSFNRSGIDHGRGDDGDRNVWMLALGPDIKRNNVIAPTGVAQSGRGSGRYETIDAVMTAMTVLGHGDAMTSELTGAGSRPGRCGRSPLWGRAAPIARRRRLPRPAPTKTIRWRSARPRRPAASTTC